MVDRLLGLSKTRIGNGRGRVLFRKKDVIEYINSKVEKEEMIEIACKQKERFRKIGHRHYYSGKNYRKHIWDMREEAVEAYQEFLDKLKREIPIIDSNISFVDAINKFLEYLG